MSIELIILSLSFLCQIFRSGVVTFYNYAFKQVFVNPAIINQINGSFFACYCIAHLCWALFIDNYGVNICLLWALGSMLIGLIQLQLAMLSSSLIGLIIGFSFVGIAASSCIILALSHAKQQGKKLIEYTSLFNTLMYLSSITSYKLISVVLSSISFQLFSALCSVAVLMAIIATIQQQTVSKGGHPSFQISLENIGTIRQSLYCGLLVAIINITIDSQVFIFLSSNSVAIEQISTIQAIGALGLIFAGAVWMTIYQFYSNLQVLMLLTTTLANICIQIIRRNIFTQTTLAIFIFGLLSGIKNIFLAQSAEKNSNKGAVSIALANLPIPVFTFLLNLACSSVGTTKTLSILEKIVLATLLLIR